MLSPFFGQKAFTGNISCSIMNPMVQLSPSFSLLSSSVCLCKSVFSVHSWWFCSVKLVFCLLCSDMTPLTAVREETVNVALTWYCHSALKVLENRLTVDSEEDDDWHQDHTDNPQTCCHQMKRSRHSSFLFIFYWDQKNSSFIELIHNK